MALGQITLHPALTEVEAVAPHRAYTLAREGGRVVVVVGLLEFQTAQPA